MLEHVRKLRLTNGGSDIERPGEHGACGFADELGLVVDEELVDVGIEFFQGVGESRALSHRLDQVLREEIVHEGTNSADLFVVGLFLTLGLSIAMIVDGAYDVVITTANSVVVVQVGHGVGDREDLIELAVGNEVHDLGNFLIDIGGQA